MLKHDTNFNSIKVRLEQNTVRDLDTGMLFQFHKGTIRTRIPLDVFWLVIVNFNSIKVRLELNKRTGKENTK